MSLDLPVKTLVAIEKIIRGFLWKGRKDVKGGHCLVAWNKVCTPKEWGGLGIPNLRMLNLALRARWLWLQRVDNTRPWNEFNIQVPPMVRQVFEGATYSVIGDGRSTFFWTDKWLPEGRLRDIAPNLFAAVPKRALRLRRVHDGLLGGWLDDIGPDLQAPALRELFQVADRLADVALSEGVEDSFRWGWDNSYSYSARSCYRAMFGARIEMAGALQIWRSRAPPNCRVFLWLAARNRCWTADRLCRRGLPHPAACPFCDQAEESIDHLLVGCVLAREVWAACLRWWGKLGWMPQADTRFIPWLQSKRGGLGKDRDLWTGIALVCWCLWRHRNDVVFEGASPSRETVLARITDEAELWRTAGLFRDALAVVDKWRCRE
jgi:hypothetical protein